MPEEGDRYFVVLKRRDFTIDDDHPDGTIQQTNMTLDKAKVMKATFDASDNEVKRIQYQQTLQPLDMDPEQLRLFMSQQNAQKDLIRRKRRELAARRPGPTGMSDEAVV